MIPMEPWRVIYRILPRGILSDLWLFIGLIGEIGYDGKRTSVADAWWIARAHKREEASR